MVYSQHCNAATGKYGGLKNMDNDTDLNDLIQAGYELMEDDEAGACTVWLQAWGVVKSRIKDGIKTVEAVEELLNGELDLFNWVQDLDAGLANAAMDTPDFHEKRIGYCREFIKLFPGSVDLVKQMKLAVADSLFQSGKKAEAEQEYKLMVAAYPKYPWGYIHWGDFYAGDDNVKAEALYRQALGLDKAEDKVIRERLRDLKES
jgi:tetratricopeptide (TPR) repeat protein